MGGSVSQVFRSGSALLTHRDTKVSETTVESIRTIFEILRANPKISIQTLDSVLQQIAKYENILGVYDECGYNVLQKSVALNHIDLVKSLLQRKPDVNRSTCSLPLHIACLKGYEDLVEILLKYGARLDCEARMCFPESHCLNCEERSKHVDETADTVDTNKYFNRSAHHKYYDVKNTRIQNAISYAIDGDHVGVLNILVQKLEEPWIPFRTRKPLLHLACERGAYKCLQQLLITRSDEINLIKDEYYPIHLAVLRGVRFLELFIQHGAISTVRTSTQQMSLLHVAILPAKKSAEETFATLKVLLENGCKELINEPDTLGNTPLHALILRYALEETRFDSDKWHKFDVLHLVRILLQNGAKHSINRQGNGILASIFRHVREWDVSYELLNMLKDGGDPNVVGRDGSTPLVLLFIPLINKDQLYHFSHSSRVCYLNCMRTLLVLGANLNCTYHSHLTPVNFLIYSLRENFTLSCEKLKHDTYAFLKDILLLLLQFGLDFNLEYKHALQCAIDMVQDLRACSDVVPIYDITLILLQNGVDPDSLFSNKITLASTMFMNEIESFTGGPGNGVGNGSGMSSLQSSCIENFPRVGSSFRSSSRYLLFYYILLISKKDVLLKDPKLAYASIIYLFYNTMSHEPLYNCLKGLNNYYVAQIPNSLTKNLLKIITELYRKPRSLKQLCRQKIYKILNFKVLPNMNKLKLPNYIRDYLLFNSDDALIDK